MTIQRGDIRLYQSEKMDDDSTAGGKMSATEIIPYAENQIFPDVSRTDYVKGALKLRKIWLSVNSDDRDAFSSASLFVKDTDSVFLLPEQGVTSLRSDALATLDAPGGTDTPFEHQLTYYVDSQKNVLYGVLKHPLGVVIANKEFTLAYVAKQGALSGGQNRSAVAREAAVLANVSEIKVNGVTHKIAAVQMLVQPVLSTLSVKDGVYHIFDDEIESTTANVNLEPQLVTVTDPDEVSHTVLAIAGTSIYAWTYLAVQLETAVTINVTTTILPVNVEYKLTGDSSKRVYTSYALQSTAAEAATTLTAMTRSFAYPLYGAHTAAADTTIQPQLISPEQSYVAPQLISPAVPSQLISPAVPSQLISPEIPSQLISPGVPSELISPAIPPQLISPAIPAAIISPAIPPRLITPASPGRAVIQDALAYTEEEVVVAPSAVNLADFAYNGYTARSAFILYTETIVTIKDFVLLEGCVLWIEGTFWKLKDPVPAAITPLIRDFSKYSPQDWVINFNRFVLVICAGHYTRPNVPNVTASVQLNAIFPDNKYQTTVVAGVLVALPPAPSIHHLREIAGVRNTGFDWKDVPIAPVKGSNYYPYKNGMCIIPAKFQTWGDEYKLAIGTGVDVDGENIGATDAVYSDAVPAVYSDAVPAVYSPAVPAVYSDGSAPVYSPAVPAVYSDAVPAVYSDAVPAVYTPEVPFRPAVYSPQVFNSGYAPTDIQKENNRIRIYELGLDVDSPQSRVTTLFPQDEIVIHETFEIIVPSATAATDTGHTDLFMVDVVDANGVLVVDYEAAYSTGIITWGTLPGTIAYPLTVKATIGEANVVLAAVGTDITLATPLTRAYSTNARISQIPKSSVIQARISVLWTQSTFSMGWQSFEEYKGAAANFDYNESLYPIEITNAGSRHDSIRLEFINSSTYRCWSKNYGLLGDNISTANDFSPINPVTNVPLFIIRGAGFSGGAVANNQLRFDVIGAQQAFWLAQVIQPQPEPSDTAQFNFTLGVVGDVDR